MNWNINFGDCELQTYTLSDPGREKFVLKLSCLQGLILIQFETKEAHLSAKDISKATQVPAAEISKCIHTFRERAVLLSSTEYGTARYRMNPDFNSGAPGGPPK